MKLNVAIVFLLVFSLISCNTSNNLNADKIFTNAKVYTVNENQPWAWAAAIKDNKIIFVGLSKEITSFIDEKTEVNDLIEKTIIPGFVSAHDHLIASGWTSAGVQIYNATSKADALRMIKESAEELMTIAASNGTTSFLCPGIITPNIKDVHGGMERDFETALDLLQNWDNQGELKLRTVALTMYKSAIGNPEKFVDFGVKMSKKFNSDKIRVNSLKIHPEGNTVAGTAPHFENYLGTNSIGAFNVQPNETMAIVTKAVKVGLDVMIHTDGDRSSHTAVEAILEARKINPNNRSALHHAIFVHPEDQQRIIDNRIPINSTPNFTNTFANGDMDNIKMRGVSQVNSSLGRYPHFARNGVRVSISTDVPSTPPAMQGPLFVAQCAVTLKDASDDEVRAFPQNRKPLTIEQAIRAITIDAAWQLKMEEKIGSIEVGKLADLVILEKSPFEVAPEKLKDIKVIATIMDGKYTYQFNKTMVNSMFKKVQNYAALPRILKGCDHDNFSQGHQH